MNHNQVICQKSINKEMGFKFVIEHYLGLKEEG
jgi:hypothetical protein